MKPYQIAMGLALAVAGGLVLFGDNTPSGDIAEPAARASKTPAAAAASAMSATPAAHIDKDGKPQAEVAILRLTPRAELVGESGEATFAAGEGVFVGQNWNPPPPPSSQTANANLPPPAPTAPPMPFVVIGKAVADGVWEVYLARGDKTYVVHNQTIIDGTYRVEKITPPLMSVTFLPLNQVQQINIGVLD